MFSGTSLCEVKIDVPKGSANILCSLMFSPRNKSDTALVVVLLCFLVDYE